MNIFHIKRFSLVFTVLIIIFFISSAQDIKKNSQQSSVQAFKIKSDTTALAYFTLAKGKVKDSVGLKEIDLAKFYEDQKIYDKALLIYSKKIDSKDVNIRSKAFEGIKRVEKEINSPLNRLLQCIFEILKIAIIGLKVFILFGLFIVLTYIILKLKKLKVGCFSIEVKPFDNSTSMNELFTHFKIYIDWNLERKKYYSKLKKNINGFQIATAKPTLMISSISTLTEVMMMIIAPQLSSIISKVYFYFFPADYTIIGYISSANNGVQNIVISLRNKGKVQKIWDKDIFEVKIMSELKSLSFEVLEIVERSIVKAR